MVSDFSRKACLRGRSIVRLAVRTKFDQMDREFGAAKRAALSEHERDGHLILKTPQQARTKGERPMDTIDPTKYGLTIDATREPVITTIPVDKTTLDGLRQDVQSIERVTVEGKMFGWLLQFRDDDYSVEIGERWDGVNTHTLMVTDSRSSCITAIRSYCVRNPGKLAAMPDLTT